MYTLVSKIIASARIATLILGMCLTLLWNIRDTQTSLENILSKTKVPVRLADKSLVGNKER